MRIKKPRIPVGTSRRRDYFLRKFIDYGILGLIVFSPLPAGSVNEWSVLVIELTVLILTAAYFLMKRKPEISIVTMTGSGRQDWFTITLRIPLYGSSNGSASGTRLTSAIKGPPGALRDCWLFFFFCLCLCYCRFTTSPFSQPYPKTLLSLKIHPDNSFCPVFLWNISLDNRGGLRHKNGFFSRIHKERTW